jgi:protease I
MADKALDRMKVAILIADGFEQVEMTEPRKALVEAGVDASIVSLKPGGVRSWKFVEWGEDFSVDITLDRADATLFDALLLPGAS